MHTNFLFTHSCYQLGVSRADNSKTVKEGNFLCTRISREFNQHYSQSHPTPSQFKHHELTSQSILKYCNGSITSKKNMIHKTISRKPGCYWLLSTFFVFAFSIGWSQPVPASDENIPFLVTFGNEAGTKWGDDDFSQTFFFKIKKEFKEPIYVRVFDPDCTGMHDESNGGFNTMTRFSVYYKPRCNGYRSSRQFQKRKHASNQNIWTKR